jgi:hypothetical protein
MTYLPVHAQTPTSVPCDPPVDLGKIKFGTKSDAKVWGRLYELQRLDQELRLKFAENSTAPTDDDWALLNAQDCQNRIEVLGYLEAGKLFGSTDYFIASLVFQHGNCPDHYQLANVLAEKAMTMGHPNAKWLYAATLDRYLMSIGELQKYGTQYELGADGQWHLAPVDPATTDAERRELGLPTLADLEAQAESFPTPAK